MTISIDNVMNDIDAELTGEYIDIPEWPGVSLGVRSTEIPAYKIALEILVQKLARKYKGKPAPPVARDAAVGALLGEHILFGWKGFKEEYNKEEAIERLTSPRGRNLVKQTLWAAAQVGQIDIEFVETETKNSVTPSVTS